MSMEKSFGNSECGGSDTKKSDRRKKGDLL